MAIKKQIVNSNQTEMFDDRSFRQELDYSTQELREELMNYLPTYQEKNGWDS
tara:strand:- start:323 stop:478 length:156 start_codon:yes stop_codon:yes gene_type:complete